jgi:MoaA/NifB/PqqE/SkfB family radical SAM enzyme
VAIYALILETIDLQYKTVAKTVGNFLKNRGELKFAFIQVTTRCNAMCTDRCNIWASKPFDMSLADAKFAIDVLAKNKFSILYFTGGETGLYPHLSEAVEYAKSKGMITSLTTNGTMTKGTLKRLSRSLDFLSVSVDHCDECVWDSAKHVVGISKKAQETISAAKALGMKVYGITFLNPAWAADDVERIVKYVNGDLGVSFAMSYPYVSSNESTFVVGGELRSSQGQAQRRLRDMSAKVLQMKQDGSDVATVSGYMKDVLRAHDGLPMKYPCKAGTSILTIDCYLDVYPCYKRKKLFNLKDRQDLNLPEPNNSVCDDKNCLVNCFKEASLASRRVVLKSVAEEFLSNPKFYLKIITRND